MVFAAPAGSGLRPRVSAVGMVGPCTRCLWVYSTTPAAEAGHDDPYLRVTDFSDAPSRAQYYKRREVPDALRFGPFA